MGIRDVDRTPVIAQAVIDRCGWAEAFRDQSVGCVVVDATTGLIVAWNEALATLLGHDADAAGTTLERIVPERHREAHRRGLGRYGETGRLESFPAEVSLPAVHAAGHEIRIRVRPAISEMNGRRYAMARIDAEEPGSPHNA